MKLRCRDENSTMVAAHLGSLFSKGFCGSYSGDSSMGKPSVQRKALKRSQEGACAPPHPPGFLGKKSRTFHVTFKARDLGIAKITSFGFLVLVKNKSLNQDAIHARLN